MSVCRYLLWSCAQSSISKYHKRLSGFRLQVIYNKITLCCSFPLISLWWVKSWLWACSKCRLQCFGQYFGRLDPWWPCGVWGMVWISLRKTPVECSTRWTWWKTHSTYVFPTFLSSSSSSSSSSISHCLQYPSNLAPTLHAHTFPHLPFVFLWIVCIPQLLGAWWFLGVGCHRVEMPLCIFFEKKKLRRW